MKKRIPLILWLLLLAGCAHITPVVVKEKIAPDLLQCAEAPAIPGHNATFADWQTYVLHLWGSWADCSAHLKAIAKEQNQNG